MACSLPAPSPPRIGECPVAILRCPVTHDRLCDVADQELEEINGRIRRGELRHLNGSPVQRELSGAMSTPDRSLAYGVYDGIAVLLPDLAIAMDGRRARGGEAAMQGAKRAIQQFYDEIGWRVGEGGDFVDSEKWEDLRPVSRDYIHKCHRRVGRHLSPRGRYLLDVASGPVQYEEYVEYSAGYEARICIDLSFTALLQARKKLGQRGIYILGDITNLPLRDGVADGAVSLHTIYHVPADEQARAFEEIYRVLRPGSPAVVVYNWPSIAVKAARLPARILRAPWRAARRWLAPARNGRKGPAARSSASERPYFHAYPHRWFVGQAWPFPYEIRVWRSVSVPLLQAYFHRWLLGRAGLAALYWLEERFPRAFGRFGAYPMIVMRRNDGNEGE